MSDDQDKKLFVLPDAPDTEVTNTGTTEPAFLERTEVTSIGTPLASALDEPSLKALPELPSQPEVKVAVASAPASTPATVKQVKHSSDSTKTTRRIAFAAMISLSGFAITYSWYHFGAKKTYQSNSKPIAKIVYALNDVQRKPITKLIWQPVFNRDVIYTGEAIRTASNAEATIEFLDSKTKIDLEPDSAIVLEESAGKLALNFLQGNLYVKSGATADGKTEAPPDITVKSGEKQIALGNSELSLGKSSSGQLDLQVLKGQAQIQGGGKTLTLNEGRTLAGVALTLLSPKSNETLYVDVEKKETVTFTWDKLQGPYEVILEAGPIRQKLAAVPQAVAPGTEGKLSALLKPGRVYYRLVARSNDPAYKELASSVFKNTVFAKTAPAPIAPEKDLLLSVSEEKPSVTFTWSNPANFPEVFFKLSRSPDFKTLLFSKVLKTQNEISLDLKTSGKYYWQLTGRLNERPVADSTVSNFEVKVSKGLPAPILAKPLHQEKIQFDTFKENGLALSWEQVTGATQYKVVVESNGNKKKILNFETNLLQLKLKDLTPDSYIWSVFAVNEKGVASPQGERRAFQIVEIPAIQWAKSVNEHQYISLKPSLDLEWQKPTVAVTKYLVRVVGADDLSQPTTKVVSDLNANLTLEKDGEYFVEVEGLDATEKVIARSNKRKVLVSAAPLLPPPQFAETLPLEISANGNGAAQIMWSQVQGASRYMVVLKNEKGEPRRELAFTSSEGQLKGLMPGEYKVVLRSVDQHGRPGPESEERLLKVPNISNLRAPKLKGLKVK